MLAVRGVAVSVAVLVRVRTAPFLVRGLSVADQRRSPSVAVAMVSMKATYEAKSHVVVVVLTASDRASHVVGRIAVVVVLASQPVADVWVRLLRMLHDTGAFLTVPALTLQTTPWVASVRLRTSHVVAVV
jgi:hypothetical protein